VIESFIASWDLFGTTYLVGLLIAATLSLVGVWVVARDHIFLGAAVAQASTLGVAAGLWIGGAGAAAGLAWLESDATPTILAILASVGTAWIAARGSESGLESEESLTGWVFLLAGSLPVLLMAHSPHGLEEVERLLFSTLLSVSDADRWLFLALAVATIATTVALHPRLLLATLDPEAAAALGLRRSRWAALMAIWLGVAVGLSIRAAGMLYAFGCLVLPALVAKHTCREVRPMLWVSPAIATGVALLGFVLAHGFDLPPAHTTVSLLCLALLVAWAQRLLRRRRRSPAASAP
jgi:ABC-type Mn2+/Zn2+ transport system permease subunit